MTVMQGMWIYYIRLKNEKEFKFQLGKDSVIGEGEWELRIKIMTIAKLYTSNLENMETFWNVEEKLSTCGNVDIQKSTKNPQFKHQKVLNGSKSTLSLLMQK